jgi:hypothetical protein
MSQIQTVQLLAQTVASSGPIVTGIAKPAAGYTFAGKDRQTVAYSATNAVGSLTIEGTLADAPSEADWCQIGSITLTGTAASYLNVIGNFVLIRAKLTGFTAGTINFVSLSY